MGNQMGPSLTISAPKLHSFIYGEVKSTFCGKAYVTFFYYVILYFRPKITAKQGFQMRYSLFLAVLVPSQSHSKVERNESF